eukprot:Phypoly_transcript_00248.p1 GENE.Phypoly_transcript_00248~~Phypoly_transcript_00248.p1  ORF type:complete len:838 (-),score=136.55 Phypoly_transcript_00248:415-2928(-)
MSSKGGEDMDAKMEKLDMLLNKTNVYTQFLSDKLTSSNVYRGQSSSSSSATSHAPLQEKKVSTRGRKAKSDKDSSSSEKTLGERVDDITTTQTSNEISQPGLVQGGQLRNYQLGGVNWMIGLWENGMNGILADEMGLGKTIQVIAFIAHLWEKGVQGPFLIVAPLSTLQNWVNEFHRWTPSVPVMMYHATKDERATLRNKLDKAQSKRRKLSAEVHAAAGSHPHPDHEGVLPVLITSYDIAINDRKYLQRYKWKYLVVDEAHRLKNFECKLICELRQLDTENRLLLTGTPLQNNLTELWSLLNFILPQIFDDLTSFQKWFDFTEVLEASTGPKDADKENVPLSNDSDLSNGHNNNSSTTITMITTAISSTPSTTPSSSRTNPVTPGRQQLISKLHSILRPFLLRRLKTDVELSLPKKKEIVLYCPMTPPQLAFYTAVKTKALQSKGVRLNNILMHLRKVCNHPFLFDPELTKSYLDPDAPVQDDDHPNPETETETEPNPVALRPKRIRKKVDYSEEYDEYEFDRMLDEAESEMATAGENISQVPSNTTEPKKKVAKTAYAIFVREQWNKIKKVMDSLGETSAAIARQWKALTDDERAVYSQRLQDEQQLVQNLTDSYYQQDPDVYMKSLLSSCGKLQLLDRILPVFKAGSHKVLIVSQTTPLLDLLEDECEWKSDQYGRMDGGVSQQVRQAEIDRFNKNPDVFIFLLSTRAGGVGINLASADTVIIYDSDWNPQSDLQAQDRAHRIGQTKPVVVYRLVTGGTVEERILQRAKGKLRLENLVIKKGNFKEINHNSNSKILSADDLSEILQLEQVCMGSKIGLKFIHVGESSKSCFTKY